MRDFTRRPYRTFEDAVRDQARRLGGFAPRFERRRDLEVEDGLQVYQDTDPRPDPLEWGDPTMYAAAMTAWQYRRRIERHRYEFDGPGEGERR